jgi:long-chain acyl-CoA synthetase
MSSSELGSSLFEGAESLLTLLMRQGARSQQVVARSYGHGAWSQFSGRDLVAHLGRASRNWLQAFPLPRAPGSRRSLLFLGKNSYSGFVGALGATLVGVDVMFLPSQALASDIRWCVEYFGAEVLATDAAECVEPLSHFGLPVYNLGTSVWQVRDPHPEPDIFELFRIFKAEEEIRLAKQQAQQEFLKEAFKNFANERVGKFRFVSFGHDGFQKPEELYLDALVQTAQNFLFHVQAPEGLPWRTLELLAPSNPFAHLSRFSALLRNGVLAFPNPAADWETNLRILRPTLIFAGGQATKPAPKLRIPSIRCAHSWLLAVP